MTKNQKVFEFIGWVVVVYAFTCVQTDHNAGFALGLMVLFMVIGWVYWAILWLQDWGVL